jgi:pimeloyl-ACP methyl ester carboxylesterase
VNESKTFHTGEVELAFSEWPGVSPPVIAMHVLSGTRAAMFVAGRGERRAFAYDHRGHGDSGRTPGAYTFVNYGRDAIAFLRGVVGEPALLIGHSLGAMAAIYVAANAPELARAIFLGEPVLYMPHGPLRDERPSFAMTRDVAGKPMQTLIDAGLPPFLAQMRTKLDPGTMAMVLDGSAFEGWDTDDLLRRVTCPVTLQHGDRSFQDPAGLASLIYDGELKRATALIRNCTVLHMAGTGHVPWLTNGDEWNQALGAFIQEQGS